MCTMIQLVLSELLSIPHRGLCVRSHHHCEKGETGLIRTLSHCSFNATATLIFRCSAFQLMSHVHSFAAVVLGVNLAARCLLALSVGIA